MLPKFEQIRVIKVSSEKTQIYFQSDFFVVVTSVVASVVNIDICVQVMAINLSNDNVTRSLHHRTGFVALNMFLLYFSFRGNRAYVFFFATFY